MNPCPTPPVCEFGEYGCEAPLWWTSHVWGMGQCWRVGCLVYKYTSDVPMYCQFGVGGPYGMCGYRPLTAMELRHSYTRGDRMGQRPEVDTVNVVPCDRMEDE